MARFRARIRTERGMEVTRLGHQSLLVGIAGWEVGVDVFAWRGSRGQVDHIEVWLTGGSNAPETFGRRIATITYDPTAPAPKLQISYGVLPTKVRGQHIGQAPGPGQKLSTTSTPTELLMPDDTSDLPDAVFIEPRAGDSS